MPASVKVPIVRIEARGSVTKIEGRHPYSKFFVPIRYVLEDGRTIDTDHGCTLKRDAVAYLAKLPMAPENPMLACFSPAGEFWGTQTQFRLFGGRG